MKPITIHGLSVSYERKIVLTNIFLDIEPGQVYGVIGPNGAGKSTLFKAILGLIEVNAGRILIKGKPIEEQRKKNELAELKTQESLIKSRGLTPEILQHEFIKKWNGQTPIYGSAPFFIKPINDKN